MHHNYILIPLIVLSSLVFSGCLTTKSTQGEAAISLTDPTPTQAPVSSEFTARFEIFTNGTRRIFTDSKYHTQSADVYIESADPYLIHVKKPGTTWSEFFNTLPFSLKKECLVTGTKHTFCNTPTKKLHFYLNDQEDPDALDRIIKPNDTLRVEYKMR